jgi:hypothetical protein
MILDYPASRQQIIERYPFFRSTLAEQAALFGEPGDVSRRLTGAAGSDEAPALAG